MQAYNDWAAMANAVPPTATPAHQYIDPNTFTQADPTTQAQTVPAMDQERQRVYQTMWELGQQVNSLTQSQGQIQAALEILVQRLAASPAPPTPIPQATQPTAPPIPPAVPVPAPAPAPVPVPIPNPTPAPAPNPPPNPPIVTHNTVPTPQGVPRFNPPTPFDGNVVNVESFMNSIDTAAHLQRAQLPTEFDKALMLSTYLKSGSPTSWFNGIRKSAPHLLNDFDALKQNFRDHFGDTDIVGTANRKLNALEQTGSCAVYASKSRELHAHLELTDQTKIEKFYNGLKDTVKDALIHEKVIPTIFDNYAELVISLDNRIHSRHLERKDDKKSHTARPSATPRSHYTPPPSTPVASSSSEAVPMEIDAIKRGPITKEEKERRRREGLCFYCGKGKHLVDDCPNMSPQAKAARAKAKASSSSGKA